jgi:hypothetical protein
MPKILGLAESGFGKTTSLMLHEQNEKEPFYIEGLNPKDTYIISVTSKDLPGKGSRKKYPVAPNFSLAYTKEHLPNFRRIITNSATLIAHAIKIIGETPIKNIVLDDTNYIMQDYYMEKALSSGWDAPKKVGSDMGKIFRAMEALPRDKNFIMLAHGEEYDKADGRKGYRMKTTGKMVQEYITPEGKFDVVLIGKSSFDETAKKAKKEFVTNDDGVFTSAKSHGIFDSLYIPNDMGLIVKKVNEYYDGE